MTEAFGGGNTIVTVLMFLITVVSFAFYVFMIVCLWRIFKKAGYEGALALLSLIPGVGILVVICILAFGKWPVLGEGKE